MTVLTLSASDAVCGSKTPTVSHSNVHSWAVPLSLSSSTERSFKFSLKLLSTTGTPWVSSLTTSSTKLLITPCAICASDAFSGWFAPSSSHSNMNSSVVALNLSPSRWRTFKVSLTTGAFTSTVAVTLSINSLTISWMISASDAASGFIALSLSHSNMNSSVVPLNLSPSRWRAFEVSLTIGAFASTVAVTSTNSLTISWMISASDAASG